MMISCENRAAPATPSSGESSLKTRARPRTGTAPWLAASVPLSGFRSKASSKVVELWALTIVAPTSTKSPTWATTRPPIRLVPLVTVAGAFLAVVLAIGKLIRENSIVPRYLSAAKSIWMPLKLGLEKVSGVNAVLI